MSEANVELVARLVAAINARELSDELAEVLLAPDFSLQTTDTATSNNSFHGVDGVRAWIADLFGPLEKDTTLTVERTIAEGEGFVAVILRLSGHGAGSGVPVLLRWANVSWFEGGKIARSAGYAHRREALEAVGLTE
jgi:ketosteroid isomerase-like protein